LFDQDEDVPYETSLLLMERLATTDVDLVLRKTGNHRLMTNTDLVLLLSELERMVKQYPVEKKLTSGASSGSSLQQQQPLSSKSKL
jgi:hypothetical protein